MFDIGWTEILFVGALALIIVGPKDLPQFARLLGNVLRRLRRYYREMSDSMQQLEREITAASAPAVESSGKPEYWDLLPPHVQAAFELAEPLRDPAAVEARERMLDTAVEQAREQVAARKLETSDGTAPT